ncbi:sialic acid-binding Ig-like lectin 5 isoform X2 [Saccopteryx bilineata]|uniref:sialic acid-binding Ig-like lectin 5 isoform X2 n=1 Tax=Saccopteryx bilineata TaxID=59482 RepID=UPI0033901C24
MVPLLLLPLLWGGSLQQEQPGYELRVQELVRVQKGLSVHVPCYFSYPRSLWFSSGSLYTYWYRDGDHPAIDDPVARSNRIGTMKRGFWNRFLLADPNTNDCSLSIRDARTSDSGTYFFRVERENDVKYSYKKKMLKLQVTDKPDIHFLEPLESGQRTQVTCSLPETCQKGRRLIFFWVGDALASLNPQTLHSSVLTFTPRPQDHGTNLTCQVKCTGSSVITQRTIWLNVFYAPRNLTIGISFRNVTDPPQLLGPSCSWEDQGLHCSCSSRAQPAPSLRWRLGAGLLEGNHSNASCTVTSRSAGPWANSSLSLSQELSAGLRLSCEASNVHGAQSAAVLLLPGKSVSQAGVVPAALGGAGVMALLSLCLCLLFLYIVRAHRKPAAGRPQVRDDEDPVVGTATWGSKQKSNTERPPDQASLAGDAPPSWEQQEIQYANLSFHRMKPQESHDQEATSSPVYSEIKRRSK